MFEKVAHDDFGASLSECCASFVLVVNKSPYVVTSFDEVMDRADASLAGGGCNQIFALLHDVDTPF